MAKPQFSVAALLVTVTAVAVVLALTFQVDQTLAFMSLVLLTFIGSAFSTVALVFSRDGIRAFGIGAAFPFAWALVYLTTSGECRITGGYSVCESHNGEGWVQR